MALLDKKLQDKIDNIIDLANELWDSDRESYYKYMLKAWDLYPEPKLHWNESYLLASEIFEAYLLENDLEQAKVWLNRMVEYNNFHHTFDGDCTFNYAKYLFEVGEFEKAFEYFDWVVKDAGYRYFEDEEKYFNFYKNFKNKM